MNQRERLVEAFGRGLAQGLTGGKDDATPEPTTPNVIPLDSIKEAVRQVLAPLIAEDEANAPTAPQLDLFTHGIENVPPDEDAERIRYRVEEARRRAEEEAQRDRVRPGEYDPNAPAASPWTSPQQQ